MTQNGTVRFGQFEADLQSGEVWKGGERVKLQDQPFKVLQVLLERPGDLVTREELQARIWPRESFGDFDHAVNVAVGKLRSALGDSAEHPSFIETVPRRGYRFVAKLDTPPETAPRPARPAGAVLLVAVAACCLGLGALLGYRASHTEAPNFQRLTVQRGTIYSARFAPDGRNIMYSAAWNGAPIEIYSTDIKIPGARSLGLGGTGLLAVAPSGAVAVLQSIDPRFLLTLRGTLGQVSLGGGSPRQIAENIDWADFAPDAKTLAVVHEMPGKERLEFPIGHVLYETAGWISHPRVSPKGDRIAFLDHESAPDDHGVVAVVNLSGRRTVLSRGWASAEGLAWSSHGSEVWFSATESGLERRLYSVDLAGHQRLVYRAPGGVTLQDIAADGRVLLTRDDQRAGMLALPHGATSERDVSWLDWSLPVGLSANGNTVVFSEQSEEGGPNYTVGIRDLRGSSPVPLGEGLAGDLSPDGKWATDVVASTQLVLLPTGAGSAKRLERGDIQQYFHGAHWLRNGREIVFPATQQGHAIRCFIQSINGGAPRPVTPEGVSACQPSPDGQAVAGGDSIYPLNGGPHRVIPGLFPGETFVWTADPRYIYAYQVKPAPVTVYRVNVRTGERQAFRELRPTDITGLGPISHILFSADGRAYVYGYARFLSELYLVTGLK
jgi:DNA-binding winged helix-turn-helix (wHTH) protein/Tol biopolymer transport system component